MASLPHDGKLGSLGFSAELTTLMNTTIVTKRLCLRPLLPADQVPVLELLTDAKVMRFIGSGRPLTEAEAKSWFEDFLATQEQYPNRHAVALRTNNQLIGFCGVKMIAEKPDFGYFFHRLFWGQGYASEACRALLPVFWQHWGEKLEIFIADDNLPSLRLAKALGLVRIADDCRHGQLGALYAYQPQFCP